ncbi:flagellar biosynthesis protein FlhB [Vannielia litorea]|uniref:EscU/YscU/HrcU family type III secretion system export apparatus switch protein n=1 Tax=Vannielia litorea TaxID=1217970 RepID=UPI001C98BD1E|nr:flagellar type III secretion system protein FlhB [Vannielia litorea]MBY6048858.1 flagellar type III secretion system protein FlhB [Vannielia litorea]MBY6076272.1 flagellar type III secretion system protein FlhB [Vannielia litorea]
MAGQSDEGEKQHEPTQKRLEDARKKGEVPRSTDITTATAYGGLLLAMLTAGASSVGALGTTGSQLLAQADRLAPLMTGPGYATLSGGLLAQVATAIAPWFAIPALVCLLSLIAQRAVTFAPEKIQFKLSRISPLSNAKNKFGRGGLFEFFKSFLKLTIISVVLFAYLDRRLPDMLSATALEPGQVGALLGRLCLDFLLIVTAIMAAIATVDFMWQRAEHMRKNRMSHQELKDEHKESEGDPYIRQQRRQKAIEIASAQMMGEVPKADVIVVNPQHYAVALKWSRESVGAPVCVAKGVDEVAARIREKAQEAGVPIHRDPPTARALFGTVQIGEEIRPEHYAPVAAAIRFSEAMRRKARASYARRRSP